METINLNFKVSNKTSYLELPAVQLFDKSNSKNKKFFLEKYNLKEDYLYPRCDV